MLHAGTDLWQRLELDRKSLGGSSEWGALPAPSQNLFLREELASHSVDMLLLQSQKSPCS